MDVRPHQPCSLTCALFYGRACFKKPATDPSLHTPSVAQRMWTSIPRHRRFGKQQALQIGNAETRKSPISKIGNNMKHTSSAKKHRDEPGGFVETLGSQP